MHEAFFFGPDDRQIFAVYHPSVSTAGSVLTVICPPLFAELNRTHGALRRLAIFLAEQGHHVLRMDYSGTGDSFGRLEEATLANWVDDIAITVQEGRDLSGCSAVRLLGVRASALLACQLIGANNDVERLVLWDPVRDGAQYLLALGREQAAVLEQHNFLGRAERRDALRNYRMYSLSEHMQEEFRSLTSRTYSDVPKNKLRIVSTSMADDFPVQGVSQDVVQFACNWETNTEGLIMSKPVLERLSQCLTMK